MPLPRHPIRTSIRSERGVWLALAVVTAGCLAVLIVTVALGDQRTFGVVLTNPAEGSEVPSTLPSITFTFDREPDREAIERNLRVDPPAEGATRWRGKTLEFVFAASLPVGTTTFTIDPGTLGRNGEPMHDPFVLSFAVREPGLVVQTGDQETARLVLIREGAEDMVLAADFRISDFHVSPDGSQVAVVTSDEELHSRLLLVDSRTGEQTVVVDSPEINIGSVAWSPDSQTMLVVRRDSLPGGSEGVPRIWLMRRSGEFLGPVDPSGEPTLSATWSPDGQAVAYLAPATGQLLVRNLATDEAENLGQPRGGAPAWSTDSTYVAFASVPPETASGGLLLQPIRVKEPGGEYDRLFGSENELRSQPGFYDEDTLLNLRRRIDEHNIGTELLFESLADGSLERTILLATGSALVTAWDIDATRRYVSWTTQFGNTSTITTLNLESGERAELELKGTRADWIP